MVYMLLREKGWVCNSLLVSLIIISKLSEHVVQVAAIWNGSGLLVSSLYKERGTCSRSRTMVPTPDLWKEYNWWFQM